MSILLKDIWPIENLADYKIHFARYNQHSQPLEVWGRSKEEWQGWQEYWPGRNDFNRPLIFSLMQFHYETDIWLFGGVFRVLEKHADRYEVELTDLGKEFIGRLKIRSSYRNRTTRTNMEPHYHKFEVQEILREPYSGRAFCGYDKIDLSFEELEVLIKNDRPDWKTALECVKGIYPITDTHTGKRYIGSAYGDQGIWSRWKCYIETGHGENKGIHDMINKAGIDYCRSHFRFALLEQRLSTPPPMKKYWKEKSSGNAFCSQEASKGLTITECKMDRLTQAQQSLLQAIERLKRAMEMSPTVQELAVELGVKAPSVFEGLKRLEDKGYIRRQARKARSIEILHAQTPDKTNLTAVPVLGMVAAGQPILALENKIGQVMVPNNVLRGKCFALKVHGDSMIDADIFEGDYVVVRQQSIAENSDIVVAMVGEEATVKRLSIEGEHIELRPENQKRKPIIIGQQDELKIIGKVLHVCSGIDTEALLDEPQGR